MSDSSNDIQELILKFVQMLRMKLDTLTHIEGLIASKELQRAHNLIQELMVVDEHLLYLSEVIEKHGGFTAFPEEAELVQSLTDKINQHEARGNPLDELSEATEKTRALDVFTPQSLLEELRDQGELGGHGEQGEQA